MSFNSNGVTLTSQFNLKSKQPLDGRYVITNQTELANLLDLALYPGLEFMLTAEVTHDGETYQPGVYKVDSAGTSVNRIADTNGKLSTEHSVTLTGDATGSANFSNGAASITVDVKRAAALDSESVGTKTGAPVYFNADGKPEAMTQLSLNTTGSAAKLTTGRKITLSGDATGEITFDGSADKTLEVTVKDDSHAHIIGNVDGLKDALNEKAPNDHASSETTYGVSDASKYGHAMASSTSPKAAGTATPGSETAKFARGDHVHPAQNAFTRVTIGTTNIDADTATDALTLVAGNNITLTPDATNDKITIASSYQNTAHTHIDGNGLTRTGDGGTSGGTVKLEVKSANGGITVTSSGVGVKAYNGITVNADGVSVKPKTSGGIVVDSNGVSVNTGYTTSDKNYKVQIDSTSGGLFVNVPWTDTHHQAKNVVAGSSTATTQTTTAVANGNVRINLIENSAVRSSTLIKGDQGASVTTDTSGNILVKVLNHATTATTYGLGTSANYGHTKISASGTDSDTATYASGVAAGMRHTHSGLSPKAGSNALVTTGTVTAGTWASTIKGTANVDGTSVDMTVDELLDCLVWHEF